VVVREALRACGVDAEAVADYVARIKYIPDAPALDLGTKPFPNPLLLGRPNARGRQRADYGARVAERDPNEARPAPRRVSLLLMQSPRVEGQRAHACFATQI